MWTWPGPPRSTAETLGLEQTCHDQNAPFKKGASLCDSASISAPWKSPDSMQRKLKSESCSDISSKP